MRPLLAMSVAAIAALVDTTALATPRHAAVPDGRPGLAEPAAAFTGRFVAVDGTWGKVEAGQTDGARLRLLAVGSATLAPPLGDRAAKLAYYTPTRRGFQFGVSYAPLPRGTDPATNRGDATHMVETAVRKEVRVGKLRALLTTGGSLAKVQATSRRVPRQSRAAGVRVAWDGVRIGSDVRERLGGDGASFRNWSADVGYRRGSWGVRAQVERSWERGEPAADAFAAGLSYRAAQDWRMSVSLNHTSADAEDTTSAKVGLAFRF